MFHWICPECGQEIAPGVKECPVCELQSTASSVPSSSPLTAATPALEVAPATVVTELPAAVAVAAVEEKPVSEPPQVALQPETVLQPEIVLQPEVVLRPKTLDRRNSELILDAIPAEAGPVMMPDARQGMLPFAELADPPADTSQPNEGFHPRDGFQKTDGLREPETFADRLADLAERLHGERVPYTAPRAYSDTSAPRPLLEIIGERASRDAASRPPMILDVIPARPLLASPPSVLLLAEPQPPAIAGAFSAEDVFRPSLAQHIVLSQPLTEAKPCAASPVQLPQPPSRVAAPPAASFLDYSAAAGRLMHPAEYASPKPVAKAVATVTLPGPALPRELMSLQAAGLVPIRSRAQMAAARRGKSGWSTRFVVVGILLSAGLAATYRLMPAPTASVQPKPSPQPAPEPPVAARSANSLARLVEVTGIRFMELNKKPQIHYLVVNHSKAPLSSLTIFVTLRAADSKPAQPPLSRFSFRSPALAAFEAKEMASPIERVVGPLELPDWQDLRADVEVQ